MNYEDMAKKQMEAFGAGKLKWFDLNQCQTSQSLVLSYYWTRKNLQIQKPTFLSLAIAGLIINDIVDMPNLPIGNHWTSLIILLIVCWWIKVAHRDKGPFVFLYHYWIAHMMYCLENSHIVLVSHTNDSYLFAHFYLFVLVLCNDPHFSYIYIIYNTLSLMINLHWAWLFW